MQTNSTPTGELRRLRGIPSHLEEAIAELENSIASSEPAARTPGSPLGLVMHGLGSTTDSNLANQLRLLTQRLSEFVEQSQSIADEEAKALDQERQKNLSECERAAKEVALAKLHAEETQLQLQSAQEEITSLKRALDNERKHAIQLEKDIIEITHQKAVHVRDMESLEVRLKKSEDARLAIKEQRDVLTVQLAAEQGRLLTATTALEASALRVQRRRQSSFGEQMMPIQASTPPINNCTTTCHQIRRDLAELRATNEQIRRELSASQERAIQQREASDTNERRLQEQLNRMGKVATQERARAEKIAYLHAALAADRRNAADLIATLQGQLNQLLYDNQRQPRARQKTAGSAQSANGSEIQEEPMEKASSQTTSQVDEDELDEKTLVTAQLETGLSHSQGDDCMVQEIDECRRQERGRRESQSMPAKLPDGADCTTS